jgi:mRNA interferase RelE/StbE
MYRVAYSEKASKYLAKMDRHQAKLIVAWVGKHLENCADPRALGKPLAGNHGGQWRYRVGDFRLFAEICDNQLVILLLAVGHRREVYR